MVKKLIHYSFILGLILFLTLLFRINYKEISHILRSTQLDYLLGGLFFTLAELGFKSKKLQKVVNTLTPLNFIQSMKIYLIGLPYGAVTPGKVGDVVKLYTLRQQTNLSRTDCIALGLVERLLEMIALVGLAGIGVFVLLGHLTQKQFYSLLFAIILLFALMFIILNKNLVHALLRPLFYLIVPESKQDKPRALFYEFYGGIDKMIQHRSAMTISLILCILGWLAGSVRTYLFALGLGIYDMSLYQCLFLIPLVTVIELIPLSILGIGFRDYALITILTLMGASGPIVMEKAISLSLLMLVLGGIPPALIGYVIAIREHVQWKNVKTSLEDNNP